MVDNGRLIFGGLHLAIFDLESKQLVNDFKAPGPHITDIDGITFHPRGGYIITLIDDARLWHIQADGSSYPLSEKPENGIDIHQHQGKIYTPIVGNGLGLYKLVE